MASTFALASNIYDGRYMRLSCVQTKDIATNKSKIDWVLETKGGNSNYYSTGPTTVTIAGQQVYSKARTDWSSKSFPASKGSVSETIYVDHDSQGKKSISVSFTTAIYVGATSTYSGTWTLDDIPRQAIITAAYDFTDLDNPSISFNNPGGFPMDVWLEPNPVSDHLCVRENIPNTGSYTWGLTDAEREALRNACKGLSCPIRIGLYTYVNGTQYHDYKDKTFSMTENDATKPAVSMSITLNNNSLPSKFNEMCIQGKSRLNVSISAQGKYSANILSRYANIGGEVYNSDSFLSNVISKEGKVDVIGYAKDSRQFTGSAKQQIDVTPYSKPLVIPLGSETAIQCYRSDGNGKRIGNRTSVWVKAKRSYYSLSGKNQCALEWRKKLVNEAWDDGNTEHQWQPLISKTYTTTNEYNGLLTDAVFELTKSYTVQIRAIDDIGENDIKNFEIPTQDVALHLGKGGKNVSVGTYCDYSKEYAFYSDWDAYFDKNVSVGESLNVSKSISVGESLSVSKNVSVGGNQMADFIIARGTSGIWTYEKWASGKAECWAKVSYEVEDLADTKKDITVNQSFPFTFTSLPTCNLTLANQVNWNHYLSSCDFTKAQFTKFSIYRGGSGSTVAVSGTADIRAIGKWK